MTSPLLTAIKTSVRCQGTKLEVTLKLWKADLKTMSLRKTDTFKPLARPGNQSIATKATSIDMTNAQQMTITTNNSIRC